MKNPVRIGVIGLGFGKAVHIPALKADPRCEVVAIASKTPGRAKTEAATFGAVRAYESWRDLIRDPDVDAVTIATPPNVQALVIPEAIQMRKHLFCEKPIGLGADAALAAAREATAAGLANMVDFEFPELETWKRLRAELPRLGTTGLVRLNWQAQASGYKSGVQSWKTDPALGGGTLRYLASHTIYYLEWLFDPIAEVSAKISPRGELVECFVTFSSGTSGEICVGGNTPFANEHRLEVYGSKGRRILENTSADYMKGFVLTDPAAASPTSSSAQIICVEPPSSLDGRIAAVGGVLKKFIDWITTGKPQHPSLTDGARVEKVMEAIERSANEKRTVLI